MNAVVKIAGKHFTVHQGEEIQIPKLVNEVGESVSFDNVLLVNDDNKVKIGTPAVKNASVKATVVSHGKEKKVIVFKKHRRKDYRRKRGHRQDYTVIKIDSIKA